MNQEYYSEVANRLVKEGKELDLVKTHLLDAGADEHFVSSILEKIKAQIYLKRRKRGILFGVAGSVLLVIGFILTVIFYHSGISIHYVMYGLTSLGVILLLVGMIDVLGW